MCGLSIAYNVCGFVQVFLRWLRGWAKNLSYSPCYILVLFLLFLCEGCIYPLFTKNNLFEYQAVMKYFENSCKSIVGISNT